VFGDEWRPVVSKEQGIDEPQSMVDAWAQYYMIKGITNMSPLWAVAIVCASYALPRVTLPKTQSRFARFRGWLKMKLTRKTESK
jgi:hypothetical protein